MAAPLIALRGVCRDYPSGEDTIRVLKDVDLVIEAGEMVAIVGASGSGKSTLMNILGCLDRPSIGSYSVAGRDVAGLDPDGLARLRREHFGFIFQRYHLLAELNAVRNVEIPAIYAGNPPASRRERAAALLGRLGLSDRLDHRPGQLSGGQQQRVSIARALMNGGDVILADEPTGALDRRSSEEMLAILDELHAEGSTIIIVTHDMDVARRADRIVELRDGVVVSDTGAAARRAVRAQPRIGETGAPWKSALDRLREAQRMALLALGAHRLRSFLTMLGIIIGIASVVCVVGLGQGSQQKVLNDISSLGTNTLEIFPGASFGDMRAARVTTLVMDDVEALAQQPYVAGATPTVSTASTVRYEAAESSAQVSGVGQDYFTVKGTKLAEGRFFDADAVHAMAQVAVIDENTRKALFGEDGDAVGKVILAGTVPCRVIGVTKPQQGGFGSSENLSIYLPYSTVQVRFLGSTSLRSVTVRVADDTAPDLAEQAVTQLLTLRHGTRDFHVLNTDDIRQTITSASQTMTFLIASIAVISLVVGGIGVMNIMLVSVSERVAEIGVRMAVGARRGDILQQFLIEAVLVCLIGGVIGIAAAFGLGAVISAAGSGVSMIYSPVSIAAAVLCSTLIGLAFGYLPARSASLLDPAAALSRD